MRIVIAVADELRHIAHDSYNHECVVGELVQVVGSEVGQADGSADCVLAGEVAPGEVVGNDDFMRLRSDLARVDEMSLQHLSSGSRKKIRVGQWIATMRLSSG